MTATGCVQILARDKARGGHADVNGLDIIAGDSRVETGRPLGNGVFVLQGAFTLWNMQPDEDVVVSADLIGLSAGRDGAPVRGMGIFVSGAGDQAGRLNVRRLETGAVYSDGGIAPGTPDQITGGVFTVYGIAASRPSAAPVHRSSNASSSPFPPSRSNPSAIGYGGDLHEYIHRDRWNYGCPALIRSRG